MTGWGIRFSRLDFTEQTADLEPTTNTLPGLGFVVSKVAAIAGRMSVASSPSRVHIRASTIDPSSLSTTDNVAVSGPITITAVVSKPSARPTFWANTPAAFCSGTSTTF